MYVEWDIPLDLKHELHRFIYFLFFYFEIEYHIAQAGLKLPR